MVDRTAIFTICSNNYLGQASLFFRSVRRFHADADLYLALADVPVSGTDYPTGVTLLPAHDLDIPDFRSVAFRYDIMEFNTAIKPFAFLELLARGFDKVLYFDPDIVLFRRLDDVLRLLDEASLILTPHMCSPPGVAAPRDEVDVMRTGVFNLGFLAASRHPETDSVLRWWARKLRYECVNDQTGGRFVDQKFMDLVPGFTDHAHVLRDTTLNVGYWNVAQRRIARSGEGWEVDGRPLGFFHFSGFDPATPTVLSKHTVATVSEPLQEILDLYAHDMAGEPSRAASSYSYSRFTSGTCIPNIIRRMFRDTESVWPDDPFESYEAYAAWPCGDTVPGARGEVVSNVMRYVHDTSADLRSRFDLRVPLQVSAYTRWFDGEAARFGLADGKWRGASWRG